MKDDSSLFRYKDVYITIATDTVHEIHKRFSLQRFR